MNILEEICAIRAAIPLGPTDIRGLTRFVAFKMSNSEIKDNCRPSLCNRPE
jgi:hypothetical protein